MLLNGTTEHLKPSGDSSLAPTNLRRNTAGDWCWTAGETSESAASNHEYGGELRRAIPTAASSGEAWRRIGDFSFFLFAPRQRHVIPTKVKIDSKPPQISAKPLQGVISPVCHISGCDLSGFEVQGEFAPNWYISGWILYLILEISIGTHEHSVRMCFVLVSFLAQKKKCC